ncbi:MAG: SDR family oxidoreductase [Flavobacteriales bacterium]|nr:SDR family oxidoreductase [Flavobacteriales bacterium]
MRILITGSNGLLGQKLVALFRDDKEVELLATSRGADRTPRGLEERYAAMNITKVAEVDRVIGNFRPEVVIHTAAMTNVDACELDPDACRLQNVEATRYLVEASERVGAHFIHLSTDFIFDGENGPYSETDEPGPLSVYGQSKLDSEEIVRNSGLERWSIVRTIIVYGIAKGLSRSNVVLWAKGALEKGDPIRVVDDQFRMPTLAEDLAWACRQIARVGANGVFHVSGPDLMSILELVHRVAAFFELDPTPVSPVKSASLGQPAARPPRTGFILDKARRELGYAPRSFEEGLALLASQLDD